MRVIKPETNTDLSEDLVNKMRVIKPETSTDLSEDLVNKISCLQLNDLNDQATLSEETKLEAQVNERGHDRNQPRERNDCPYTRNLTIRSSNLDLLSSPPITRELLLLSGGTEISPQNHIANDSFVYINQDSNVQIHETLKASDEEDVYRKIHEKICENEELSTIPFDESSNLNLPNEVVDLVLENEEKIENAPAISPNSCIPETCSGNDNVAKLGTTGTILYVYNPVMVVQSKKPPLIFPKIDPANHVQNQTAPDCPCKKECSQQDRNHKRFLKLDREGGLGKRDDLNRTFLHIFIMKKKDKFAVYLVNKIRNCFQRGQTASLKGIQDLTSFINSCDSSGQTSLFYSALYNQPEITDCLLKFGADPNVVETQDGNSPLHAASERGKRYMDVTKLICQSPNVDMDICNKKGKSALHVSVQSHGAIHEDSSENICEEIDSGPIIEHLLHNKASLTTQDKDGKTPLHLAVEMCKPDLIRILEGNAKDWKEAVNMRDKKGSTALHIAALLETEEAMQRVMIMDLLSRNAQPTIRDSLGRLPAELVSPERKEIADLLKQVWSQELMEFVHI